MALDNASLLSQLMERSQMQSVGTFDLQSRNNMFSNTYNSDWSDHSNSMWWEPQHVQEEGYWPPYEEFYSTPMQPPQPAQSNVGNSSDNDKIFQLLTTLTQGLQLQNKERENQDKRLDYLEKQIGQIAEFVESLVLVLSSSIPFMRSYSCHCRKCRKCFL